MAKVKKLIIVTIDEEGNEIQEEFEQGVMVGFREGQVCMAVNASLIQEVKAAEMMRERVELAVKDEANRIIADIINGQQDKTKGPLAGIFGDVGEE